jgi:predicted O-methyltransferase YrrM
VSRARRIATRALHRVASRLGLTVIPNPAYSPLVSVPAADDPVWTSRSDLPAVRCDLASQLALVEGMRGELAEFTSEVRAKRGFELWNGFYQAGDAETLYAMIRRLRPERLVELGSGYSTLVTAAACARNAEEGSTVDVVAFDPEPRTDVRAALAGIGRLEERDCRTLDPRWFDRLGDGDVLFVDTSHVVKLGSEVNWLVLEVLPRLAPGVHVHFHDVFLPYEYPRYLFEFGGHFNEQYLLHAFLVGNRDWEVTLALAALAIEQRDRLVALLPSLEDSPPGLPGFKPLPAAYWIHRRD